MNEFDAEGLFEAEAEAMAKIEAMRRDNPDVVSAIVEMTLMASPNAGPIRILRELEALS